MCSIAYMYVCVGIETMPISRCDSICWSNFGTLETVSINKRAVRFTESRYHCVSSITVNGKAIIFYAWSRIARVVFGGFL